MRLALLVVCLGPALLAGCMAPEKGDTADGWWDTGWGPPQDGDDDAGEADTGDAWVPEEEDAFPMLAPSTTDTYVFVANPDRDTLTRISVPSLEVLTVGVGGSPALVETTADNARAVVFNEGTDDLSIVDAETLAVETVALRPDMNAMVLSPDGAWAFLYRDADLLDDEEDASGGIESFNEASLVNLHTLEHFPMVVGQYPRQVRFTDDSSLAIVVGDVEVALVDLTAPTPDPVFVQLALDPLDAPAAEEVEVAPSGAFAFIRQFQSDEIVVLDLATGTVDRVPVGYNPTDLDLTPDGSQAVVVSRGAGELWLLDAEDPFQPAEVLTLPPDEVLGSLVMSPDGSTGFLYTTAVLTEHYTLWDVAEGTFTTRRLVKPVRSVSMAPTGDAVLVFHTEDDGSETQAPWTGAWALTLLKLADLRQNPLQLAAEPESWCHADDGTHGFLIMDGAPSLVALDYGTLLPEDIALRSLPIHVGTLPGTRYAYASQEHSLGRISFYDAETGTLETITGFELNAEVEH